MKTLGLSTNKNSSLMALLAIAFIVLSSLSVFLITRINNMGQAADRVNHSNVVRLALSETLARLKDAETEQRGFLMSKDSLFLSNYYKGKSGVAAHLDTLRSLVSDNPEQLKQIDTLNLLVNKRLQLMDSVLAQYGYKVPSGPSLKHDLLYGQYSMDIVQGRLALMEKNEMKLLQERTSVSKHYIELTPVYAFLLTFAALLIILFAFYKIRKQLNLSNKYLKLTLAAEMEARKSSVLIENAEQLAGIASWGWNFVTGKQEFSKNLYRLFGYEPGGFGPGMNNFLPLIDEADRNELLRRLADDRKKGNLSSDSYFWATRKDGARRYFHCLSRFAKNEIGEEIIMGTSHDITEEYLLKQEAHQRAHFIEQVVDLNVDMIAAFDTELRVTLWNKAYEEAFGVLRQDIMGKKLTDVFPYLKDDIKTKYLEAALEGKETIRKEFKYFKNQKDGQISIVTKKNKSGDVDGLITIIHDITDIKKAETRLKENNIRFEQAEEAGKLGSYQWNIHTGELKASKNLCRLFGQQPAFIKPSIDLFYGMLHPEDKDTVVACIQKNIGSGEYSNIYCRIVCNNGEVRFIKTTGLPVPNELGETVLFGSILDITEEELLKQQLQERNQLVESLVENSADMIEVIDTEMHYTIWNKANEQHFGLKKEEVLGKKITDIFPALLKDQRMNFILDGLKGKPTYRKEQLCINGRKSADFSYIPLHNTTDGSIIGLLIMAHDITERIIAAEKLKKANLELQFRNKALQETYAFNRHITDLAPNGIYVYDKNKRSTVYTNKKMIDLHGYSENELKEMGGGSLNFLIHPEDLSQIFKGLEQFKSATDDEIVEFEYRMLTKDGLYRNVMARETIFKRNEKGEPEQFIGVTIDVSDIKRAEKELKEKNQELLQTNEELASFNYIASHDLQEPLRKIQTFSNYLEQTEKGLSEQGLNNLKRMQLSAARMRDLINDLLSFSRIDMVKEDKEFVDLNQSLKGAKSSLRTSLDEKGARIVANELPVIQGVSFQLQQLFENIIGNAVKYCSPGTAPVVNITCKKIQAPKDGLGTLQPGVAYFHICFRDNGIGFEPQYATKIFELFQRLHTKSQYPGTGIGLAICKKIVQSHGGHIQASSQLGEGSLFEIYLPVAEVLENASL